MASAVDDLRLFIAEFGAVGTAGTENHGVVALTSNRWFGGDSGYFYTGTFQQVGPKIIGEATVIRHSDYVANVFGDNAEEFQLEIDATMSDDGSVSGTMKRFGTTISLAVRLTPRRRA